MPDPSLPSKRDHRQGKEIKRRETEHAQRAKRCAQQERAQARVERGECALHSAGFSFSTSSECSRRLSARCTRKRRSSSSISSPRLGKRPKRFSSSPPIVSYSSL